jgi:hypothetical protein
MQGGEVKLKLDSRPHVQRNTGASSATFRGRCPTLSNARDAAQRPRLRQGTGGAEDHLAEGRIFRPSYPGGASV